MRRRRADSRQGCGWLAALLLAGLAGPLSAQVSSPTLPQDLFWSGIPQERILAPRDEIDSAIADSRFHLGPVRLSPVISIPELTYDNNVFATAENPTGDFRATISAGVGLILPVSHNFFVRAGIFPAYTWYADLEALRFFGGATGASFIMFANRLTFEGSGNAAKEDVPFSSENQSRVIRNLGTVKVDAEFRLLARLFVYGEGQIQQFRFTGPGAEAAIFDPAETDRTDQTVRAELRYKWSDYVRVAAGYRETRSEFVTSPQLYDNRTSAVIGTIYYDRQTFFVNISGGYSELKPINGSSAPPFSGLTGSSFASYTLVRPLDLQAFAIRGLSYGLTSSYYVSTRYGGGLALRVGWRLKLQGFASAGTDDYSTPFSSGSQLVDRKDDVTSYGGRLDFLFSPRIQMRVTGSDDRYTSNVPGNDRSFFRWLVSLNLGGNLLQ